MSRKHILMLIVVVISLFTLNGCSNDDYINFSKEFEETYYDIIKRVHTNEVVKTLENLQITEIENNINRLKELLERIKDKVPSEKKMEYDIYTEWYNGLILLRDSYSKWDKLTQEEKEEIWIEVIGIGYSKRSSNN